MPNPGITFKSTVITGIVERNQWNDWLFDNQETHAFGVEGASSTQGALITQDVSVPIIVSGYDSQLNRDNAIRAWQRLAGSVGSLQIRVGGGVVIFNQAANVKLMSVSMGIARWDSVHGFSRETMWNFRLLASS